MHTAFRANQFVKAIAIVSLAFGLGNSAVLAAQTAPLYEVGHAETTIHTEHSGSVDVHISFPKNAKGSFPLIVFSHGHYLSNDSYTQLSDRWVAQGYFVAAPLHLDTGDYQYVQQLTEKVGQDWIAVARILDMKAVINQATAIADSQPTFLGTVTTDKVIAAGHSLGALSAQHIAGATVEKQNDSLYPIPESVSDDRIVAVIAVSPPGLVPDFLSEVTWQDFTTPQLVITGTEDVFEHIWQDYRAHLVSYLTAKPGHNYALVSDGMDHYMGGLIGRLDRPDEPQWQALNNVANISLLFMRHYLHTENSQLAGDALLDDPQVSQLEGIIQYERR